VWTPWFEKLDSKDEQKSLSETRVKVQMIKKSADKIILCKIAFSPFFPLSIFLTSEDCRQ